MQLGEVRVAEDSDFNQLKDLCQGKEGWKIEYDKNNTTVWTKTTELTDFKMLKLKALFPEVAASTVFDVLNDPDYRKKWDVNMIEAYEICHLGPNNDIGYYALKVPKPLKNRDFVVERSWLDLGNEYLIFNHSVNHASLPHKKNFVRGVSYLTGYQILPTGESVYNPGCCVYYITQTDPRGKLPAWTANKAAKIFAPKILNKLHKACKTYPSWKEKHEPHKKSWIHPDQITLPKLDMKDILPFDEVASNEVIDETDVVEEDINEDDVKEEE